MPTKQSGIRLAKRLDEVGFSDIVQIRNKVMGTARGGSSGALRCTAASRFSRRPRRSSIAAIKALVENQTHYAPSSGVLPLRKALVEKLAAKNSIHVTTDEVIATVGGSQGLYAAFQSVLDPGDDALVFSPYWTPIGDLVTGAQARPLLVPTITARRNGIRKTLEAVLHATRREPSTTTRRRIQAAWSLRAPRRKRLRPLPSSAT